VVLIECSIAVLRILNNLDSHQWRKCFEPTFTAHKILPFIYSPSTKQAPLVRSASINMLGYMVYFDMSQVLAGLPEEEKKFKSNVYQIVIDYANDTNINVQMRNSWTLANLNFTLKFNLKEDEYLAQELLITSIAYAVSNKEKVSSNGVRSLGYFLQNADLPLFEA
jgi:hypothetical protein